MALLLRRASACTTSKSCRTLVKTCGGYAFQRGWTGEGKAFENGQLAIYFRHMAQLNRLADAVSDQLRIARIRQGYPPSVFRTLRDALGLSDAELAAYLHIPRRTLTRRLRAKAFSPEESDRMARLAAAFTKAARLFGPEEARAWMKTPLDALAGETPLRRCDTTLGAAEVEDVLGRIDYGVYS
jgi:putative toxin-antitoxin system antitoxin component (TIGR02293 family)